MSRLFQWTNDKQRRELVKTIRADLQGSLKRCNDEGLEFICEADVESIWTPTRIQILSKGLSWDEQTLQHRAHADFKKILSILVWIHWDDWNDFKKIFLEYPHPRRADDNLPLNESPVGSGYHFSRCQYIFIPIMLLEEGRHHTNDPPEYERPFRMPFLESIEIGKGAQGVVTKELVAAKHFQYEHGHPNSEPIWLARKEIERGDTNGPLSRDFRAEQGALRSFKKCLGRHDNIMLSLTTFTHGSHFNIMSPLADLDLRQFLTGEYHDYLARQTRFTAYDLLMEAACLVGALDFLHHRLRLTDKKIACAHLDFKPENVLVIWNPNVPVRSVGQWLVHDFGTARIKEPSEAAAALAPGDFLAHFSLTKATRNPGPFQAPEVQATTDRVVGRESDMWSFGCMLAVILAFATGGKSHVSGLARSRDSKDDYFYTMEGRKPILKPSLVSWLEDLNTGQREDKWIERTLEVIYKILVDDPKKRFTALKAQEEIDIICSEESLYMQQRCEWTRPERVIEDPGLQPVMAPTQYPSTHNSMNHRRPVNHVQTGSNEFTNYRSFSQNLQPPPIQTNSIHHSRSNSDRSNGYPGHNSPVRYPSIIRSDTANMQPLYSPTSSSTTYQNFPPPSGPSDKSSSFGQSSLTADAAFVHLPAQPKVIKTAVCAISTRVAFLSKSLISVHNLNFQNSWSPKRPSKPTNGITDRYVAQKIPGPSSGGLDMMSLCGDFIVVRAVEGTDYKFLRYQCQLTHFDPTSVELWTSNPYSINNNMSVSDSINSIARFVVDVTVNIHGDTLFTLDSGLCYFSSRLGFHTLLPTGQQLRRASFSSDGRYVFAWTLGESHLHENRWYIWDASSSTQILNTSTRREPAERLGYGKNGLIFPLSRSFVAFEIPNRVYVIKRDAPNNSAAVTRIGAGIEDIVAGATNESTEPQTRSQSLVMIQQKSPPRLLNLQLSADIQNCRPSKGLKLQEGFKVDSHATAIITDFAGTFIVVSHPSGLIERRKLANVT